MANINMISGLRAEVLRTRRITRVLGYAIVLVFVVLLGFVSVNSAAILRANGEIRGIEADLRELRPQVAELRQVEAQRAALRPKIRMLEEAHHSTLRWHAILASLQRSVPSTMWLTGLSVESGAADVRRNLRLTGHTANHRTVGETMQRLNREMPLLADYVGLRFVQASPHDPEPGRVNFELSIPLVFSGTGGGNE